MFSLTEDYKQLTLDKQIAEIGSLPNNHPVKFLRLLSEHFDLPTFIVCIMGLKPSPSGETLRSTA